jgi:hypothetical protein
VHIDPTGDGAAVAFAVIDRVRNEMLNRVRFYHLMNAAGRYTRMRKGLRPTDQATWNLTRLIDGQLAGR